MNYYTEDLPDDLAKIMLGDKYQESCVYQMTNDAEGMYITGYNKETGERINLSERSDGIPDDMEIGVEEFELADEEIKDRESHTFSTQDYNKYMWLVIPAVLLSIAIVTVGLYVGTRIF